MPDGRQGEIFSIFPKDLSTAFASITLANFGRDDEILYFSIWCLIDSLSSLMQRYEVFNNSTITVKQIYLATRPDASPPISFSTSSTVTKLKSPFIVCFKHDAATAKSSAF